MRFDVHNRSIVCACAVKHEGVIITTWEIRVTHVRHAGMQRD